MRRHKLFQAFATQAIFVGRFIVGSGLIMGFVDNNKKLNDNSLILLDTHLFRQKGCLIFGTSNNK